MFFAEKAQGEASRENIRARKHDVFAKLVPGRFLSFFIGRILTAGRTVPAMVPNGTMSQSSSAENWNGKVIAVQKSANIAPAQAERGFKRRLHSPGQRGAARRLM
ncbi:hypothetical protein V5F38_08650 [Xanthobacter sp. V0B-10]|uniref:hypothetical protein n=1 Tax=Xanthobacter albus TaxID=3119929 RepID=UPI003726F27B